MKTFANWQNFDDLMTALLGFSSKCQSRVTKCWLACLSHVLFNCHLSHFGQQLNGNSFSRFLVCSSLSSAYTPAAIMKPLSDHVWISANSSFLRKNYALLHYDLIFYLSISNCMLICNCKCELKHFVTLKNSDDHEHECLFWALCTLADWDKWQIPWKVQLHRLYRLPETQWCRHGHL